MSKKYLQVQDNFGLVRDCQSGAIINVDDVAYKKYKGQKMLAQLKYEKELSQENRINTLEKKLDGMEQTLSKILEIIANGNS